MKRTGPYTRVRETLFRRPRQPQNLLPVTNNQNIPEALFLQALRPHSPRLLQCERWVATSDVARVSRRAVSPFLATCLTAAWPSTRRTPQIHKKTCRLTRAPAIVPPPAATRTLKTKTLSVGTMTRRRKWPRSCHILPKGVCTCLDHTLHVVVGPRTPSHEPTVRCRIDLYGVLKQAVEQQSTRP